ncbi:MAG TPA: copper chaperone PCu(A)C [Candidatus Cybelea sp.]|nr:copper chaperone PCu(A)C [Candidatus Cybelea sp.]
MRFPIKGFIRPLLILALAGVAPIAALAHEFKVGDLEIVHPWARATLKGSDVADGFMKIVNHGSTPDKLIAVSVEFAPTVQIHEMKMDGQVMKMEELKDGLEIPAGATVELKPGADHIMFLHVNEQMTPDEMLNGELTFEKAGKVKVEFLVEPAGTSSSMDMD